MKQDEKKKKKKRKKKKRKIRRRKRRKEEEEKKEKKKRKRRRKRKSKRRRRKIRRRKRRRRRMPFPRMINRVQIFPNKTISRHPVTCGVSGFRRRINEIFVLLGRYAAFCGTYLSTFWENISSRRDPIGFPFHPTLPNIPEQQNSHHVTR